MSNNIVIHNQSDFLVFIRDQAMPNGNLSIRGVARCCGVDHAALIRGGDFHSEKLGQTLVTNGFKAGDLCDEGFPAQAVWLCIEYYAFESRAKAPMAKQIARTFGAIGVMATLKELSQPNATPQLSCHAIAIQKADAIRHITDELSDNPRLAQLLIDFSINDILTTPQLPGTAQPLRGVAEIAVELGFKVDASNRVKLGNYIKAQGFDSEKEKRLCNGVMTDINCYRDTPELRKAIAGYFC
jgi:hypothetical protein